MAYQDGHDKKSTTDGLHMYNSDTGPDVENVEKHVKEKEITETTAEQITEGKQSRKPKPGLLERARRAMFGEKTAGEKLKSGWLSFQSGGGFAKAMASVAKPKALTALVMSVFMGTFGLASIFTSYKNDDVIRNDNPIQCEPGSFDLPAAGEGSDNDVQETVNIMYDIFVEQFGYSEYDLVGMVACMIVETGCNPDRLESDFILTAEKEKFDAIAGPGTNPTSDVAQQAYWAYGEAFKAGGGWNGNPFYMSDGGRMCPGIGLIQWTAGRANNFIRGLDKVSLNVSPMDVHYQCAYLIAEAQTSYQPWAPGGDRTGTGDSTTATTNFFGTMVYGHMPSAGDEHLQKRLDCIPQAEDLVFNAQANSEFTMDAVTMAEELAEEGFSSSVAQAQFVQLCVNDTFIVTSDIAKAAVSISFLERGDYEDVQGAYGSYRRAARSPNMINDWNYIEGKNQDVNTLGKPYNGNQTYASARGVTSEPKKGWKFYDIDGAPGKLDLIACTEYYYFAHLIAFPKETGVSNAGYFSSCDRGTATAVRIAGADDKFPAGNPMYQLMWACGGAKQGAKHNENARGTQGPGFLWKFSGFMRGSDWYSASGSPSIANGTVMISWSVRAANGLLNEAAGGGATDSGMLGVDGESDDVASPADPNAEDPSDISDDTSYAAKDPSIKWATLRWPMAVANSTRHIITYVGDSTVKDFWGIDWLQQQWSLFDDADRLIRKDLTETVPEVMKEGLALKSQYAKKNADQHMTFYKADATAAKEHDDTKEFEAAIGRKYEFNIKTGLPVFHSWEQIYTRLIHNSDDDAAAGEVSGGEDDRELNERAKPFQKDGYLDDKEQEEIDSQIEQYDNEDTFSNKQFFNDWNSLGAKGTGDDVTGHEKDYQNVSPSSLIWHDGTDGFEDDPWTHSRNAVGSPLWRYELVTDIEYRQNQFLRFGLASLMCSYPSEEDADTYQAGVEGNDTGHIIGNLYRRYSRIPDEMDTSGRYYYFNTVVSNDMLQDLVQLYNQEKNSWTDGETYVGNGGKDERNFGPMYTLALGRVYDADYSATSNSANWLDRRYGLTEFDIDYIQNKGIEGNKMGEADGEAVTKAFTHILTEPMHMLSASQLALYDNTKSGNSAAINGAHESQHKYNDEMDPEVLPYEAEIYGMNPFLMLESEKLLNIGEEIADGTVNWEAGSKSGKSVRNSVDNDGVDIENIGEQDDRLSWIDRHYFVTKNGAVGTFAYQVLGLQPSTGSKVRQSQYEQALKNVETLDAGHEGQSDTDNLYGSMGLVQYSDFIYAEDERDNERMARRLFGGDDRNNDDKRDDYNRREYYVIPYYHTHAQQCDHSSLNDFSHYDLLCRWQDDTKRGYGNDNLNGNTQALIDTQVTLMGNDGLYKVDLVRYSCDHQYGESHDFGETISFNETHVKNRGKYDLDQLVANIDNQEIRYFADTGDEILWNAKPYIHVLCDGWYQANPCTATADCACSPCYCPGDEDHSAHPDCSCTAGSSNCTNTICHACGQPIYCGTSHTHSCQECLDGNWCHDHKECDDYGRLPVATPVPCQCEAKPYDDHHHDWGRTDDSYSSDKCHYEYGCNALEFLYHNIDGQDGNRQHYRLRNKNDRTPQEYYSPGSMELYTVNNIYMVIPAAPDVDMKDFKIDDYLKSTETLQYSRPNNEVITDKCNLLQQVTYDSSGWVDNNWQTMIDKNVPASLLYPYVDSSNYINAVRTGIASQEQDRENGSQAAIPSPDDPTKGLLQYFTIEGDSIHREEDWLGYLAKVTGEYGSPQSEYIMHSKFNGTPDDLRALDPIRNRVGYGKTVNQKISSSLTQAVSQGAGPGSNGSSSEEIRYENSYASTEQSDAVALGIESHGYGELAVVGTQHPKGPQDAVTDYGNCDPRYPEGDSSVTGPDGSQGNHLIAFGPSLLREIIGDEHVVHVKFDVQDYDGLTAQDAGDNGRDFMFYTDKKAAACEIMTNSDYADILNRIASELGKAPSDLSLSEVEANLKPKDYQNSESKYYQDRLDNDDFLPADPDSGSNKYGVFKNMDMDTLYLNYYTGELTDKMYAEQAYPHNATDKEETDTGTPNKPNPLATAVASEADGAVNGGDAMQKITSYKEQGVIPNADGMGQANTGDYRNWVTHASRGHRGMMTQYLNFASFFKDVYKAGDASEQDGNNAYMLFESVMRTDIRLTEEGGKDEYGYPMGSDDADGVNYAKYGGVRNQDRTPTSKSESFVYVKPPSDAIRQIGTGVSDQDSAVSWGYGDGAGFSDTYGQGGNSHWKNMIDLYNAAMSTTREYGY